MFSHRQSFQFNFLSSVQVLTQGGGPGTGPGLIVWLDMDLDINLDDGYIVFHEIFAGIESLRPSRETVSIEQDCKQPSKDSEKRVDVVFTALSGAQWRGTGKLSRTVSSVSISNILLKPL